VRPSLGWPAKRGPTAAHAVASKDHLDLPDNLGAMEIPETLATMETKDPLDAMPTKAKDSSHSCPSATVLLILDQPDPPATPDHKDPLDHREVQAWMDALAHRDLRDPRDLQDPPETLDPRDHPEPPVFLDLPHRLLKANPALRVALERKDLKGSLDKKATMAGLDLWDPKETKDPPDHRELLETRDLKESLDSLVPLDHATTARQPVWPPDGKGSEVDAGEGQYGDVVAHFLFLCYLCVTSKSKVFH